MKIDPTALGEFLEQNAIETAGGAVIDVLDGGLMTQPGIAQPGEQALITPIADLAIEQQAEPFRMSQASSLQRLLRSRRRPWPCR